MAACRIWLRGAFVHWTRRNNAFNQSRFSQRQSFLGFARNFNSNHHFRLPKTLPILSLFWFSSSSKPIDTNEKSDVDTETKALFRVGLQAILNRDWVEADEAFHKLLKHLSVAHQEGEISNDRFIEQRCRVYSEMAHVKLILGQLEEAERLIKRTIRDCLTLNVPMTDAMMIELSLILALIYQQLDRVDDARTGFAHCVATQEEKLANTAELDDLKNEEALLGMCCNYYSKFLFQIGQSYQALDLARKSLNLALQLYPPEHSNCINLQCDIAVILIDLQLFDEARILLEQTRGLLLQQGSSSSALISLAHVLTELMALEAIDDRKSVAQGLCREVSTIIAQVKEVPAELNEQFNQYCTLFKLKR